jgi:hypothetical protein
MTTPEALSARFLHTAVWTGSQMVIFGGMTSSGIPGTVYAIGGGRYDPAADAWLPLATVGAATVRQNHTAVWTGTQMIIFGGLGPGNTALNTGGRYDPVTDTWTPTSVVGADVRNRHAAVWTGSRMLIWGASTFPGGRYDPVADAWTSLTGVGAPDVAGGSFAAWTGSRMLTWGGSEGTAALNTGGRYLALNLWVR